MCHALNVNGKYAESLAITEKASQTNGLLYAALGYAYAKSGRRQEAEAVLAKMNEIEKTKTVSHYWEATIYVALGEKDKAFAELGKAYQAHDWFLQRLKVDPFMDPLRDDRRFAAMVKRLNLPE